MQASIITIGDEILIGQVVDTNSVFIAQELNRLGIWVHRKVAVGDDAAAIKQALAEEEKHSGLVLVTGGLGPTADDITKPVLCEYFGAKLVVNEEVLAHVKYLFEKVYRRPGPLLAVNLKQAEVPDQCTVLLNLMGTAPGMWFEKNGRIFVSMPGVPSEMKYLMTHEVVPRLAALPGRDVIEHRTMLSFGQGESMLAERIRDIEEQLPPHIKLAYLPQYAQVRLRLTATGSDRQQLSAELDTWFGRLRERLADVLVADEDLSLETVLARLLNRHKQVMATAESCTGGYIAHLLTANPQSSSYFTGGIVCYDKRIKIEQLGVDAGLIETRGTVNEDVCRQMVEGIIRTMKVDYGVAVTGLMGPDAGGEAEPVGTVWIGVGNREKVQTARFRFGFDRRRNIETTALHALNMLRRFVIENAR